MEKIFDKKLLRLGDRLGQKMEKQNADLKVDLKEYILKEYIRSSVSTLQLEMQVGNFEKEKAEKEKVKEKGRRDDLVDRDFSPLFFSQCCWGADPALRTLRRLLRSRNRGNTRLKTPRKFRSF